MSIANYAWKVHADLSVTPAQRATMTKGTKVMPMVDPTEWALEDSQEPYAMPDGTECRLRIMDISEHTRPDESSYYNVRLEVCDEPYSKEINAFLNIPSRTMDAKRLNSARRLMSHFLACFEIDTSRPSDPQEDWIGQEGWCILSLRNSPDYGEQNRISKYITAR